MSATKHRSTIPRPPLLMAALAAGLLVGGCDDCGGAPTADGALPDGPAPEASLPGPDARPDLLPDVPPDAAAPLLIIDVKVESNPRSVLSCFVSWRTSEAASSQVEYWEVGAAVGHRVSLPGARINHRVLVFGMHAETAHQLQAISGAGARKARSATLEYTTGKLPLHVPRAELITLDRRRAQQGWTLMTLSAGTRGGGAVTMDPEFVPTAVMYDMEGRPVWYREHGLPRVGDARYFDGRVLVASMGSIHEPKYTAVEADLSGRVVWNGPRQPLDTVHRHHHHHFQRLARGTYLTLRNNVVRKVMGDVIVEMAAGHQQVWTWSSLDHIRPDMARWDGKTVHDYTHGNSLHHDRDQGVVYYNARHQDAVYKIDLATGKVLWKLGAGGDFAKDPAAKTPWFLKAHGVEVQPNGDVLLYDNGMKSRPFSRAVQYRLNEQQKTARIVWQYDGKPDQGWVTYYWGDADRLPNGNTLICAGTWAKKTPSRIFEVTPDRRRVWEIKLPKVKKSGYTIGAYNSQRLGAPLTSFARQAGAGDGGP